jgi:hypothetical protein
MESNVEPKVVSKRGKKLYDAAIKEAKQKSIKISNALSKPIEDEGEKSEKLVGDYNVEKNELYEEDVKTSHIIVATKVSRQNFEELSAKHKDLRLMWKDETVILYEYPIKAKHEYCISFINTTLSSVPHILACGHPTMVTANWEREGDQSWASRRFLANPGAAVDLNSTAWPAVVLEVGLSETVTDLHNDAQLWLGAATSVQAVIIIKVWKNINAMLAMLFTRAALPNPTHVISFGTAAIHPQSMASVNAASGATPLIGVGTAGAVACNAAGLAAYQLPIPAALLFTGDPNGVPMGVPANINIDLFRVQEDVLLAP